MLILLFTLELNLDYFIIKALLLTTLTLPALPTGLKLDFKKISALNGIEIEAKLIGIYIIIKVKDDRY